MILFYILNLSSFNTVLKIILMTFLYPFINQLTFVNAFVVTILYLTLFQVFHDNIFKYPFINPHFCGPHKKFENRLVSYLSGILVPIPPV